MKPPHHTVMGIKGGAKHHFVIRDDAEHDAARVDDGWDAIGNVAAVCGLQSSGGLAIVDWLDDHGNVVGSRTENRYVSGRWYRIKRQGKSWENTKSRGVDTNSIGSNTILDRS